MQNLYLLYHELRPSRSDYSYVVECSEFEKHLDLFARVSEMDFSVLRPEITFDDGHCSNYEYALPRLVERNLQASFFVTAGWIATRPGYMNWEQLAALCSAGQGIGAHGWSHTLLTHCSGRQLDHELADSRKLLEDKLGVPVTTMSLPGGRFNRRVLAACEEAGYTRVFTSVPRPEKIPPGPTVGRMNVRGDMTLPFLTECLRPESRVLSGMGRQYRIKEAAKSVLGDRLYAKIWAVLNRQEADVQPG